MEGREREPTNPNALTDLIDLDGDDDEDDIDDERGRMVEWCGCSLGDVSSTSSDVPVRRGCWPQRALMVSKKPMQNPFWSWAAA